MFRSHSNPLRLLSVWITAGTLIALAGFVPAAAQPERPEAPPAVPAPTDTVEATQGSSPDVRVHINVRDKNLVDIEVNDHALKQADYVRFGESIHIAKGERVSGDVVALGGSIVVEGMVDGDCVAIGGSVTLKEGAEVEGEVVSLGGVLTLEDSTRVGSDAVSIWGKLKASPGAEVMGNVSDVGFGGFRPNGFTMFDGDRGIGHRFLLFLSRVVWVFLLVGLGILAYSIFPRRMERLSDTVERRGLVTFLAGMAGWILWLPAFVLLCITIVGIPVAILLLVFTPILLLLGYLAVAQIAGKRVGPKLSLSGTSTARTLLVGVLALEGALLVGKVLGLVGSFLHFFGVFLAVVGWSVIFVAVTMGFGAFLITRFRNAPEVPIEAAVPGTPPPPVGPPTYLVGG